MTDWRRGDVAWVEHGDRIALVHLRAEIESARVLDGSAAEIWRAVGTHAQSAEAVTSAVADSLGIDADAIAPDIEAFLQTLAAEGLLVAGRTTADGVHR